jgi:hypothetical protein
MYNHFVNGKRFLPAGNVQIPSASLIDRWADWLRILFPLGTLLNRTAPTDPVHGIALPDAEPEADTSMITAYYLSFYE